MTKTSEFQKVTNRRRAEIANEAGADLMVRLHCDAYSGSGFAVYYPTRKGRVSGVKGPSDAVIEATKPVAKRFYAVLAHDLTAHLRNNGLKGDTATAIGSKQGALTGSIFSKVPVVLVEMVDLKNPKDETFITSEYGLTLMSKSLADAALKAVAKQ